MSPVLLLLSFGLGCAVAASCQTPHGCADPTVTYQMNSPQLAAKFHVRRPGSNEAMRGPGKEVLTTQGTRWLMTADADYLTPGPWSTTFYVGDAGKERPFLALEVRDHGNTITGSWINEKLLFVEVWWSRFAATDAILDVTTGSLIYSELAQYGPMGATCATK